MPSTPSSSVSRRWPSSTVMTPSRPTRSKASAIMRPISSSPAEIEATRRMSSLPSTGVATLRTAAATASAAASMPLRSWAGEAPAARLRRPSSIMARASTVAVVVPSPLMSLVLVATSLTSAAPMFSKWSSNSMSRAMVTPSLMTSGAPNFLSRMTLRPRGPRVTDTASARASAPRFSASRASTSKTSCLAGMRVQGLLGGTDVLRALPVRGGAAPRRAPLSVGSALAVGDDGENVLLRQDQVLGLVELDLTAGVLRVDHAITDLDVEGDTLPGLLVVATVADRLDQTLLGLLLGSVGQHDAALGHLLALDGLDHDTISKRTQIDGHEDLLRTI